MGLIFAQMGLTSGAVTSGDYSALMLAVMGTTFFTPPVLRALFKKDGEPPDREGKTGVAQIVTEA